VLNLIAIAILLEYQAVGYPTAIKDELKEGAASRPKLVLPAVKKEIKG
jgi:hypothetical protein